MKITDKLTTDFIVMYIDIPTDKGTEHYSVELEHRAMDEDIYSISIYDLDTNGMDLYSQFEVNSLYEVINDCELDEREYLILSFITNRLELD